MNNAKPEINILKLIWICTVIVAISSCNLFSSGYKTFKDSNEICSLSFEYQASYGDIDGPSVTKYAYGKFFDLLLFKKPQIGITLKVPDVGNMTSRDTTVYKHPADIRIGVTRVDVPNEPGGWQHPTDAKSLLESRVKGAEQNSLNPHFQILERSSITVSSVQAERVIYLVDELFQPPNASKPLLSVEDRVCFDYKGLIWEISSSSYEEYSEQTKADFEHVLQTFKILE